MKTFLLLIFAAGLWAQAPIAGPVVSGGGGGGGTGCVPAGTANKIPTTDGSGGCNVTGVNIDGSNNVTGFATITAGNGQSITYTGSGIINASKILGTTLTTLTGVIQMTAGVPSIVNLTGVLQLTAGAPSVVTGPGTNCVLVNGTSAACGGGGGSPGGSNTNVQFNNSAAFGGDAGFAWNNTLKQIVQQAATGQIGLNLLIPAGEVWATCGHDVSTVGTSTVIFGGQDCQGAYFVNNSAGTARKSAINSGGFGLSSDSVSKWFSGVDITGAGSYDTGLARASANTVCVNQGGADCSTLGNLTAATVSTGTADTSCNGTAGCDIYQPGTAPSGQSATGIQVIAPTSFIAPWRWVWPNDKGSSGVLRASVTGQVATYSNAPLALTDMATQAADSVVMNASASVLAPTAVAMPACTTGADLYNTSTHSWSCVSTSGGITQLTGDVTAGPGSGSQAATVAKVNGIAYSSTAAAHTVQVTTTANTTVTAKVIPDCQDTGGNHLNFTQSTDAFSCGTSGGGGGGLTPTTMLQDDEFLPWNNNGTPGVPMSKLGFTLTAITTCFNYGGSATSETNSHPGIYKLTAATTSGNGCVFSTAGAGGAALFDAATITNAEFDWVFLLDSTTTDTFRCGFGDTTGILPANFLGIRYIAGTDTNWTFESIKATSVTTVDSTVAPSTSAFFRLKVTITGGTASFSLSNEGGAFSTVKTLSTLPTAVMSPYCAIQTNANSNTVNLLMDYFGMTWPVTR